MLSYAESYFHVMRHAMIAVSSGLGDYTLPVTEAQMSSIRGDDIAGQTYTQRRDFLTGNFNAMAGRFRAGGTSAVFTPVRF